MMLQGIARLAIAAPRRIIGAALLVFLAAAVFGIPVAKSLSPGGFQDPNSESARAIKVLTDKFGQSGQQMLILVTSPGGVNSEAARSVGTDVVGQLQRSPLVYNVTSPWTGPAPASGDLVSTDGKSGLIVVNIKGGENNAQKNAQTLADEIVHDRDGVTVRAGGSAMEYAQINEQNQADLLVMEAIAIPLSFLVLVWVFGGLLAAALPMALGALAVVGSMSALRLVTFTTEVSIFALNLSTALGLALAIDYTLLIISRYRDELAEGSDPDEALIRTMATSGRTVLFSATTVALSMAATVAFPMYFLKSFAYAGVATVAFVAAASIMITPAAIVLLGPRLDAWDVRRLIRRMLGRPEPVHKPVEQLFWYRSTKFVMRRWLPIGLAVLALLVLLGLPFLSVKWGFPDDRVLPRTASAHQVGDRLRKDFAHDLAMAVPVVVPDARGLTPADLDGYAADLSRVPDVSSVSAPSGTFVGGNKVGPPAGATGFADGSAFLTVYSIAPLFSQASDTQLTRLHQVGGPAGRSVEMAGVVQVNRDSVAAVTDRLPLVLGLMAVITLVLLFLLTGSVVLPVKALVCNVLSLSAAFGALVWIFQDGHLGALGTTPSGTLVANMPVLLFCIAFGLSMDYEVFLVARIREYWLASGAARPATPNPAEAHAANDESVALGVARTGRVITAAALVMSMSFAALIAAHVSFMRMFGLGLTLAVAADATLVRVVLVPAFMHVMGSWNWWAPKPLVWLHERFGISEGAAVEHGAKTASRCEEPAIPAALTGKG
ncbi:Trehalose monomycolate exporter MmpL3 [Mycobacterium kansasii]|uniref:Membrane protein YdfJ n=4 Tax=Mycobacterium kansasii TaxID=1768 RepID=A0A653F631_MYCKA|nr:membrane protein [Mycobacterium kansasii ATCC 12478]KEP39924.1 membrane protein [Mycobacterium kansasii]VAZ62088.1 Trehalose monomycolate exporter MmpL3 [Mycobacterium kansasii]VAZ68523.1 Trehalose monomycolate exporter MmpL3 [Mycobacterium kansasii]VAZ78876.1 Trehalose monomycolate exporter MmpL3 [Mycobacterium kansasii]